jgi:hypothetical protein
VERGFSVDAYAEIIATRPLGMWCTDCTPMDVGWRKLAVYFACNYW